MLHTKYSDRGIFLCLAVLISSLANSVEAEESASTVDSASGRSVTLVVDKTLKVISMVKLAGKSYYDRGTIQFEIDEAKTLIELRLQFSDVVLQKLMQKLDRTEVVIEQLTAQLRDAGGSAETSRAEIQSMEALEELSRNCLLEQQRLEWDAVTEESKIEASVQGESNRRDVEQTRLKARKLEIEGIEQKLAVAREELEYKKSLIVKGALSTTEAKIAEGSVRELQNQLNIAMVNLEAIELEASSRRVSSLEKSALSKKSRDQRMKLINMQLEELAKRRKTLSQVVTIDSQIALQRNLLQDLKHQIQLVESERMSYEVLQNMLEIALEKSNQSAEQTLKEPKN